MKSTLLSVRLKATVFFGVLLLAISSFGQDSGTDQKSSFSFDDYRARRSDLLDSLGDGTAILYSRGEEGETGYRADGNFWYLTGLDEPGAILILSPKAVDKQILLLPTRNTEAERWTGARPAITEELKARWGFDRIYRKGSLDGLILSQVGHDPKLHLISPLVGASRDVPEDLEYYRRVSSRVPGVSIENSSGFLEKMRMIKSEKEIAAISKAIEITHNGISDLLGAVTPGIMEFQLEGVLQESFKKQGAQYQAFAPIIGAGSESTVLHYERLNGPVEAGDLLLLDIGAEWDHYCADISRTVPVDGKFTSEQGEIYDIVLKAQKAAIDAIKPGVTVREVDEAAREVIRKAGYVEDFIHGTSHFLGLSVHDRGDYWTPLQPGMVITVEPGIYLPDSDIGIRIEDDVLVTKKGHKVLSEGIPKERSEIENWISRSRTE